MRYRLRTRALTTPLQVLDERRRLFDHLQIDPTHAEWIRRRTWLRTVHGSTRIVGNAASTLAIEALLAGEGSTKVTDREAREIIGVREALALADELAAARVVPDEGVIREFHRRVLWNQGPHHSPGEYRRGERSVVDADGDPILRTPPSGDVPGLMEGLAWWLATAMDHHPAPIVAALALLELAAIHPFDDGNGRTARALARLILVSGGYGFDGLVSFDAHLDLDRAAYFGAIRDAIGIDDTPGYDATPFVDYLVTSLTDAADHVLERLRGLDEVMVALRLAVAEGSLPPSLVDSLAYAWVNRHLRARDHRRLTGRSPQNTTRDLDAAIRGGWLLATGERRGRTYVLGPKLLRVPAAGEIVTPPG